MSGICDTCKREPCHMRFDGCKTCDVYEGGESNYMRLFGTPERAARTLELLHVEWSDWCAVFDECRDCMFGQVDGERVTCWEPDDFSLVEWLRGDAE